MTNNTVTAAPSAPASVEIDPELAQYITNAVRAFRRLHNHLDATASADTKPLLARAYAATLDGMSQELAAAGKHRTARPEIEEVSR